MPESVHNPDTYMFDFRQIVTNGRKKIGILLGAGAPVSINIGTAIEYKPLIPNIEGLTKLVKESLIGVEKTAFEEIETYLGISNIERMLSEVRALAEVIGTHTLYGLDAEGHNRLSESICKKIKEVVSANLPAEPNPYSELISWINGINRTHGVEIFTTNYDLLCEEALERAKTPYFDGFSGSKLAFFDPSSISKNDLPPRWVRLWKLHGSIGWSKLDNGEIVRLPECAISTMVYPSHIKYSQTQAAPFSSLFERLKGFLMEPDTLLITTGFSFADAHISSKITECLSANPSAAVFAFQFNNLEFEECAVQLAFKTPNLSLYCRDGAVINSIKAKWRVGELPTKNWLSVQNEFMKKKNEFILGDFKSLARFLALAGGEIANTEIQHQVEDNEI
ncbi:SIR2 family protein [Yersinia enterocolitica]|uniref:SIR2 family protein n=1 Tax=Yersinia enterocolitica TaxID=630 RepID=UPI0005E50E3E|nr:SIR2 family protein [Yersinia enterocolitica]EKN3576299.1 SIR2 family protein [Yersinia enterocolitica]EKN3580355.1 SIR2 family protein [Yersinia enterocolitica]EKN4022634.1 SIR2 family protein [Yersinia enterocolitica]EKN4086094.1 SIR2 family protein [Yersinia enterocolitica]EKN4110614.1 SIR2 family protein [Yersinia enterocolitica]